MESREQAGPAHATELGKQAIATVRRWVAPPSSSNHRSTASHLNSLLGEAGGLFFAAGFIDGVLRPRDLSVAAHNLELLSRDVPKGTNWFEMVRIQLLGGFAPIFPAALVPLAREGFLKKVGQLLVRLSKRELGRQLAELRAPGGIRPTLAPISARPSGQREADRQLADALELLRRPDVDALLISLASVVLRPRLSELENEVETVVQRLAPLFDLARGSAGKTITLDIARSDELELTLRVFQRLGELYADVEAGITLPAYLPDCLPALQRLQKWAQARFKAGGARVFVRLVKGEMLGEEQADAALRELPLATFANREDTDAQFKRMLDYAVTPARCAAVAVVVATHNLFDVAFAWRLARRRGVERWLEYEFLLGLASEHVDAVKRDVGGVRLYAPVVQPGHLELAVPYLIRRIHELGDSDEFLSTDAQLGTNEQLFEREQARFTRSLAAAAEPVVATNRRQDPNHGAVTDFTIPVNRDWAAGVELRAKDSLAGEELIERSRLSTLSELELILDSTIHAGENWAKRGGSVRADVLVGVANALGEQRGQLVEVAMSESALTLEEADLEVSVAMDLAMVSAENARALGEVVVAEFVPDKLTVVVSPRSGPIATPAGALVAALAAGSAVILKTAPETRRSAAVLIETLRAGGIPVELVLLVDDEAELARALISNERVDRVALFGSRHTAKLFHSWRAEMGLVALTGGRNSIIVDPSADLESAVEDVVESALDHAGQAPAATSVVILVGSVGSDSRFLGRLTDRVASVLPSQISALARDARGGVRESLTVLGVGERWLVEPKQLDELGRVWTPGLRDGVKAGSAFHTREGRAPVLGIMRVKTISEAIAIQNSLGFGLAAGLQAQSESVITAWLADAEAGMLFVNRATIPGLRSRMPFGGWNRSQLGVGWMSGGPNELIALGEWSHRDTELGGTVTLEGISDPVAELIEAAQPGLSFPEFDRVRRGARSDEEEWRLRLSPESSGRRDREHDDRRAGEVKARRSILRYRPIPVTIRAAEGASHAELVRVLAAATLAQSPITISTARELHDGLLEFFGRDRSPISVAEVVIESNSRWNARVLAGGVSTPRIRLIGGERVVLARVLHGQPGIAVFAGPVTSYGRTELLSFLREQSISIAVLRHGYSEPRFASMPVA